MTDKEKLMMLVSYINGAIGNHKYYASIDVESYNKMLIKLDLDIDFIIH